MIANQEIARNFELIAALLSIQGANPFRVRAYREAARFVNSYPESLATQVARESDLTLLPTIGLDLAEKIIDEESVLFAKPRRAAMESLNSRGSFSPFL